MTTIPTFALNDGSSVPAIGFGTYPLRGREGTDATLSAIDAGYRLIDTAVNHRNEDAVGAAVRETDVPRDELVVATKLPGRDHGFEETITSCRGSLASLGLEVFDHLRRVLLAEPFVRVHHGVAVMGAFGRSGLGTWGRELRHGPTLVEAEPSQPARSHPRADGSSVGG